MPVFIKVSQNKIKDSKSFGKWYGRQRYEICIIIASK